MYVYMLKKARTINKIFRKESKIKINKSIPLPAPYGDEDDVLTPDLAAVSA